MDPENLDANAPDTNDVQDNSLDSSLRDIFRSNDVAIDEPEFKDEKIVDSKDEEKPDPKDNPDPEAKPDPKEEKQPAPKAVVDPKATKAAAPAAAKTDASDPDKIKPPAKLSKENLEGWNALKETAKKNYGLVQAKDAEIQKLQQVIASKSETSKVEFEKLQTELKELRGYRASFDHQFDPEFQKQYSTPMAKLEVDMKKILTGIGVKDDVLKILKFSDEAQMSRVIASVEENVNKITADRFRSRVKDYIELNDKKTEFLEEFKTKHEEFKSQREKEFQTKNVEAQSVQLKHINDMTMQKDEAGAYKIPFLLKYEPNPDATPEQIKAIEDHNANADRMRGVLDQALAATDPKDRAEVAVAAVAATFLKGKLDEAVTQIASLKKQLEKYNKASSENPSREVSAPRKSKSLELGDALAEAFPNME